MLARDFIAATGPSPRSGVGPSIVAKSTDEAIVRILFHEPDC